LVDAGDSGGHLDEGRVGGGWLIAIVEAWTGWGLSTTRKAIRCDAMLYRPQSRSQGRSVETSPLPRVSPLRVLCCFTLYPSFPLCCLCPLSSSTPHFSLRHSHPRHSPCQGGRRSPMAVSTCFDRTEPPNHRATEPPNHRVAASPHPAAAPPHHRVAAFPLRRPAPHSPRGKS
jgi:hypothetical protein